MAASIMIGPSTFGSRWTAIRRPSDAPIAISAWMNSLLFKASVWVRTARPNSGMEMTTTTKIMVSRLGPASVTTANANITTGNERNVSNSNSSA